MSRAELKDKNKFKYRKPYQDLSRRQQLRRLEHQKEIDYKSEQFIFVNNDVVQSHSSEFHGDNLEVNYLTAPLNLTSNCNSIANKNEEDRFLQIDDYLADETTEDVNSDDEETQFWNKMLTYSDDEDDDDEDPPPLTLWEKVAVWALKNYTNRKSVNEILSIFRSLGHDLPKDARTLLGRGRKCSSITCCGSGNYLHYGLKRALTDVMKEQISRTLIDRNIVIDINIDGLPLAKSSKSQLWPILAKMKSPFKSRVFLVGAYHGYTKPSSIDEFLDSFLDEYTQVKSKGFKFLGEIFNVSIDKVLCDTPARCMITCTKPHNSHCACPRCTDRGEHVDNRMCFFSTTSSLRTDESFSSRQQKEHHTDESPFEKVGLKMITQFPLDPMHLRDLGMMKRILKSLLKGHAKKKCKLRATNISDMSRMLLDFNGYIPCEFVRKIRAFEEVDRWKAVEFRMFLYYLGPVLFNQFLPDEYCLHFNTLHAAMSMLSCRKNCRLNNTYADELLHWFVENFSRLYGKNSVVFTTHCVQHLAQESSNLTSIDDVTAYPFENYMMTLKKMIRRPSDPLPQLFHGFVVRSNFSHVMNVSKENNETFPKFFNPVNKQLPFGCVKGFDKIIFENFELTSKQPDNYCYLKDSSVFIIEHITVKNGNHAVIGRKFKGLSSFPNYPFNSQEIELIVAETHSESLIVNVSEITRKAVVLYLEGSFYIMPLLHTRTCDF